MRSVQKVFNRDFTSFFQRLFCFSKQYRKYFLRDRHQLPCHIIVHVLALRIVSRLWGEGRQTWMGQNFVKSHHRWRGPSYRPYIVNATVAHDTSILNELSVCSGKSIKFRSYQFPKAVQTVRHVPDKHRTHISINMEGTTPKNPPCHSSIQTYSDRCHIYFGLLKISQWKVDSRLHLLGQMRKKSCKKSKNVLICNENIVPVEGLTET